MNYINELEVRNIVKNALKEDIGRRDITTEAVIPLNKSIKAALKAKEDGVICGLAIAALAFRLLDKNIKFKPCVYEGASVKEGKIIAYVCGRAQSILSAERVALNFLTLLCGISTLTRKFVEAVKPYKVSPALSTSKRHGKVRKGGVKIMDTRKTIPGLRILEKYAVRIGGGYNHRFSLDEMVLIKDNHLKVIGNRLWVIGFQEIKNKILPKIKIEVEVKTLKEFRKALKIRPDIIMLDNMRIGDIKRAVRIRNKLPPIIYHLSPKLEVSGGITLKNVKKIASCGVEMISVGALTHSVDSLDISLEVL